MNRILRYGLTISISMCFGAALNHGVSATNRVAANSIQSYSGEAAFEDGLYLGKLDAIAGRSGHLAIGRWREERDRSLFTMGYNASHTDNANAIGSASATAKNPVQ